MDKLTKFFHIKYLHNISKFTPPPSAREQLKCLSTRNWQLICDGWLRYDVHDAFLYFSCTMLEGFTYENIWVPTLYIHTSMMYVTSLQSCLVFLLFYMGFMTYCTFMTLKYKKQKNLSKMQHFVNQNTNITQLKGIVSDSNNIILWHESEDINKKKSLFPKFQLIPILHFQVMRDNVWFIAPIDYCVE